MSNGLITTGSFPKDLLPGVNKWFGARYNAIPQVYKDIFKMETSDRNYEEDVAFAGPGIAPRKNQGEETSYSSANQLYVARYVHNPYGIGMKITREARDDGMTLKIAKQFSEMIAESMAHTKNIVSTNILNRAFDNNYNMGSDSDLVALCSDSHQTNAGLVSNRAAVGSDLSELSLEQAILDIEAMKDFSGKRAYLNAKKLIVHNDNQFEAFRILKSELRVGTADNDANAIKDMVKLPEGFCTNRYLTDPGAFFITTDSREGLKGFTRVAPELRTDQEFDSDIWKYKGYERYSFGCSDWHGIYGNPGA